MVIWISASTPTPVPLWLGVATLAATLLGIVITNFITWVNASKARRREDLKERRETFAQLAGKIRLRARMHTQRLSAVLLQRVYERQHKIAREGKEVPAELVGEYLKEPRRWSEVHTESLNELTRFEEAFVTTVARCSTIYIGSKELDALIEKVLTPIGMEPPSVCPAETIADTEEWYQTWFAAAKVNVKATFEAPVLALIQHITVARRHRSEVPPRIGSCLSFT